MPCQILLAARLPSQVFQNQIIKLKDLTPPPFTSYTMPVLTGAFPTSPTHSSPEIPVTRPGQPFADLSPGSKSKKLLQNLRPLLYSSVPFYWSTCGVGSHQFPGGILASTMGGHIRVGLEDNTRVLGGKLAEGSWEQVEVAKRIAELAEREVATPAEARKILNLRSA